MLQEQEADRLAEDMYDLKNKEKETAKKIKTLRTNIAHCEEELARPLDAEDIDAIKDEAVSL